MTNGEKGRDAVLVIDMQPGFLYGGQDIQSLIENQLSVLEYCAKNDVPVFEIATMKSMSLIKPTIEEIRHAIGKVPRSHLIEKTKADSFENPQLGKLLSHYKVNRPCLMGVDATCCVQSTGMHALDEDYISEVITSPDVIANSGTYVPRRLGWYEENAILYPNSEELIASMERRLRGEAA